MTTGQQTISVALSGDVAHALLTVSDPAAVIDRALRRELRLPAGGRLVGRPRRGSVEDLTACLGSHTWTSGEFQRRAHDTLDISRATFYRLLKLGQEQYQFRQRCDGTWKQISASQKTECLEAAPKDLP